MKLNVAIAVAAAGLLAACDGSAPAGDAAEVASAGNRAEARPAAVMTPAPTPPASEPAGAPAFAALYPDAAIQDAAEGLSSGPSGTGGIVTYTTEASPDAVIEFHRSRAEAAGLRPVMAMSQGDTRAYGAAENNAGGANVSVVASPSAGGTSVQLTWSAG